MKRKHRVEPFSMTQRHVRYEGGRAVPCVKVKVRGRLYDRLPADVLGHDPDGEIFNMTAQDWWEMVPQEIADTFLEQSAAFAGCAPEIFSAGRSSGWCCVSGIGEPDEWTDEQSEAWERFKQAIEQSMRDTEQVYVENIRANIPTAYLITSPHGLCRQAGKCIEHELDPEVEPCR